MSYLDCHPLAIRKNLLLVLASILLLAGVSQADDLILDPITLKFTKTPWAEGTSLELPKFDPALGTLQSVSLSLVGRAQSFGVLFNSGNFDETVFVTVESLLSVKLSDTLSAQVKVTGISATEDVLAGDSTPSPTASSPAKPPVRWRSGTPSPPCDCSG